MRHATIVPLIGGMTVAATQATGKEPEFLVSFKPFGPNEENLRSYYPNVPYYLIEDGFNPANHQGLDFVQALCPCAGLSMLSAGDAAQRATMNKWMLNSAKLVTEELKPTVFWGENAPGLYSKIGTGVIEQFKQIARDSGYAFSVYLTNTLKHGVPQDRKRTFYFFWKGDKAPILEYHDIPYPGLDDYLKQVPKKATQHDVKGATKELDEDPLVMFLRAHGKDINDIRAHMKKYELKRTSLVTYLLEAELLPDAAKWLREQGHLKDAKFCDRVLDRAMGDRGFWNSSKPIYQATGAFATLMARHLYAIHPTKDRVITTRERMHLMGLPHDFELTTGDLNHICQNVPVKTASDMTRQVMKFINGQLQMSGSNFLLQSNLNQRIDCGESALLEF